MTAAELALALNAKKSGDSWITNCVAHDDKHPSMSISEVDGKVLVKCHANCDQDAVIGKLKDRGLWNSADRSAAPDEHPTLGPPSASYDYHDAAGRHVGRVMRFDRQGGKEIRQCSLQDGAWTWKAMPAPRKLYRLPSILKTNNTVLIVEGEKAAAAAAQIMTDMTVTTWAGGAKATNRTDLAPLKNRDVILWPDHDPPGADAMHAIAKRLQGIATSVRMFEPSILGELSDGWDAADALANKDTDLDAIRSGLANASTVMTFPSTPDEAQEPKRAGVTAVELRDFLALALPTREYLIHPIIPRQGLVMIHGPRGLGKTYVSLGIAYAIASGGNFLKWSAPTANGVLFVDGEMPAQVLQERLSRIVAANAQEATAPLKIVTPDLNIDTGLPDLSSADGQAAIDAHVDESIDLIILDNLSSLVRSGVENDAESWLPMQTWALRHRAAGRSVLFIHHSGKGGAQRGTSRREDVLDTVISLRKPVDYCPEQGARFEVHVEKARGFYGDEAKAFDAHLTTDAAGNQAWTLSDLEESNEERIIELHEDGLKPNDIAQELHINRATVYRRLKKAGLLQPKKPNGKVVPFKPRNRRDEE